MRSLILIAAVLGGLLLPAKAQTIWSRPYQPNQVAVEVITPELPNDSASGLSGATFLTVTRSFTDNLELVGELPLARSAAGATAVGNPYVGMGLSSTRLPVLLEVGARIPAVPSNRARSVGQRADLGRTAAFRDEAYSLSGLLNARFGFGRYTSLRLRTGLTYTVLERPGGAARARHWYLPYSAQLWHEGRLLLTGLSLTGRPAVSDAPTSEAYTHRAVVSVMLDRDQIQPGLFLGTGLDDLFSDAQFTVVFGLTLSFSYD